MKSHTISSSPHGRTLAALLCAVGILLTATTAHAATLSWTSTGNSTLGGDGSWNTSSSLWWTGSAAQAWTTNTTAGDTAVFGGTSGTVTLGTNINALGLTFNTTGYTLALNGNTLALGTGGINAAALTSGTTTISGTGGVGLAGNQTWDVGSGATLAVSSGISSSTAGTKILTVQGAGNTTVSGAITAGSGVMNLVKFGTGTLTLSGGGALGTGGITNGNSGATLSAVLLGGTTKISSGTYTSASEFVVGGVLSNGGAGVNTNFTIDGGSLTSSGYLSLGRGNGIGAVSSDIVLNNSAAITAANFSAGFNGGNATNLPKGTFTLNNASGFTVSGNGVYNLAESGGSNMTMTLNDSATLTVSGSGNKYIGNGGTGTLTLNGTSSANLGTGLIAVGQQNGSGILNVNGTSTFTSSTEIRVAYSGSNGTFSGSGTINVGGGTLTTQSLTVARNNNDVASTLTGTVNLTSGTINVTTGTSLIGWRGTSSTGTLNISGGNFNQGSTSAANMNIGSFSGVTGAVNVSGGNLNLDNNSSLTFANVNAVSSTGTFTISGSGAVTFYSNTGTTPGGTGVVDLKVNSGTGTSTINLDGGTLTANQIKATNATGTRVINFNGGTLKVAGSGSAATFLASGVASTANVRNGGAIINTNGINTTIGQALVHSTLGGDNASDGGLTKQGSGTLTISSNANTYTGATTISAGTLSLGSSGSVASSSGIIVASGASFDVSGQFFTLGPATPQTLRGAGTVTGAVSIGDGSTVAAGGDASTIGTLSFSSTLTGTNGSIFSFKLNSTAGTFDLLTASGTVTLGSATLSLFESGSGAWTGTTSPFSIVHGSSIAGTFMDYANGSTVTVGSNSFTLNYTSTDVTLTAIAIPEPSTFAAITATLVLGAVAFLRRRRQT